MQALQAQIEDGGLFDAIVVIEPVVFTPDAFKLLYGSREAMSQAIMESDPLSVGASRRKATFASRKAAHDELRRKAFYKSWDPRAFGLYMEHGFKDVEDGARALVCPPLTEAWMYRGAGSSFGTYAALTEIKCPVLVISGQDSAWTSPSYAADGKSGLYVDPD
ncbi:hypothetical protein HKX48_006587 [Thoreauomyces humboldtii]|nr:hypothetical protein HKX48_006587 [Thoreauomyces humboldtii]